MAASEKFKDELRNNDFVGALKTVLSEAIELEIATWVVPADQDALGQDTPENALPGHLMRTRINLVDGDIDNEIGSLFVGDGPYTELRRFHLEQVQQGQNTIHKNLTNLKQIFEILVEKVHGLPQTEDLLMSKTEPGTAAALWPSEDQQAALDTGNEMSQEADPTVFSGSLEAMEEFVEEPANNERLDSQV